MACRPYPFPLFFPQGWRLEKKQRLVAALRWAGMKNAWEGFVL